MRQGQTYNIGFIDHISSEKISDLSQVPIISLTGEYQETLVYQPTMMFTFKIYRFANCRNIESTFPLQGTADKQWYILASAIFKKEFVQKKIREPRLDAKIKELNEEQLTELSKNLRIIEIKDE
jgi:hypothetical protein